MGTSKAVTKTEEIYQTFHMYEDGVIADGSATVNELEGICVWCYVEEWVVCCSDMVALWLFVAWLQTIWLRKSYPGPSFIVLLNCKGNMLHTYIDTYIHNTSYQATLDTIKW